MQRFASSGLLAAVVLLTAGATTGSGQDESPALRSPIGFSPAAAAAYRKVEAQALAVPTPENARNWLRTLTEEPHPAGSRADYKTALFVRDKLREWGWKAELAEYEVLLNYPKSSSLQIQRPEPKELSLIEAPNPADKDSASPDAFPAFHGYGISGTATGQVVYANYGQPEDFAALEKMGVEVKDKIVLVRYGAIFRGLKVRNAQKRGARGILIYSDPADDGYARGDIYPTGPFRPGSALQRGSVQFLSLGPGDPSTPNGASTRGAKRLPWDPRHGFPLPGEPWYKPGTDDKPAKLMMTLEDWEKETGFKREDYFATIPSLPISYDAARPILEALGGPNAPQGWQGGLPIPYHVGPGPAEVQFGVEMEYALRPVWNVIATIQGSVEPDRWVIVGNHRDAWVYGAVDPSSGTAATLEACRAIGTAVKNGWKPRRTLVYASWDAEEYGLVGSTEWCDENARELDAKAALLLNVDSAVAGPDLDIDGVPSLRDLVLDACAAVTDVRSGKNLRDVWVEKRRSAWAASTPIDFSDPLWAGNAEEPPGAEANGRRGGSASAPNPAPTSPARFSPQLNPLGSGSDYTAFLDHLGVPSLDVGFAGKYGVYHSIFDDFYWMERFCDPEFLTHATAAKLYTAIAMRAAGADVLPLRFTPYGEALREYIDDLRRTVERRARGAAPGQSPPPMEFDGLTALVRTVKAFQSAAAEADRATEALSFRDDADPERLARVNANLQRVERAFLMPEGLPGRPWFKHSVYAPGLTTGYASWPLPGVRQAVQDNDSKLLAVQGPRLVQRIDAATQALRAVVSATRSALTPPAEGEAGAGGNAGATEPVRTPPAPAPTRTPRPAVPGAPRTGEPKTPARPSANPRPAAPAPTSTPTTTTAPAVPEGTPNRRDR